MSEPQEPKPTSYAVLLSGTHVTGKETLAVSLSRSLNCSWIKAETIYNFAKSGARSQVKKGYSHDEVFGRIWFSKLRRMGFLSDGYESDGEVEVGAPRRFGHCTALISCYSMPKPARDAIRHVMLANSIKPIFVILQITEEVLSGRTLGAEEPELAKRIMGEKLADIEEPVLEEEPDVTVIDSMRDIDFLYLEIKDGIDRQLAGL